MPKNPPFQIPNNVHHPRKPSPNPFPGMLKRPLHLRKSLRTPIKTQRNQTKDIMTDLSNNIPARIGILPMPQIPRHVFDHCLECLTETTVYQAPDISDSCAEGEDVLPLSWSYFIPPLALLSRSQSKKEGMEDVRVRNGKGYIPPATGGLWKYQCLPPASVALHHPPQQAPGIHQAYLILGSPIILHHNRWFGTGYVQDYWRTQDRIHLVDSSCLLRWVV